MKIHYPPAAPTVRESRTIEQRAVRRPACGCDPTLVEQIDDDGAFRATIAVNMTHAVQVWCPLHSWVDDAPAGPTIDQIVEFDPWPFLIYLSNGRHASAASVVDALSRYRWSTPTVTPEPTVDEVQNVYPCGKLGIKWTTRAQADTYSGPERTAITERLSDGTKRTVEL